MSTLTNPSDPQEAFRLFFSYVLRKICEHDLTVEKFNFWLGRYRPESHLISQLIGTDVQFDNIKNVLSSTEKLFSSPYHVWIHSQLETYVLVRYNRDFDILNIPSVSLITPLDSISMFVTELHKSLITRRFDANKAFSLLSKNEVAKQYLQTFLSKDMLNNNDILLAINRLFDLQRFDANFSCLLSVPQLSFVYYALPFYDIQSNEFQVKQSLSTSITPSIDITNPLDPPMIPSSPRPSSPSTRTSTMSRLSAISQSMPKKASPIRQAFDGLLHLVLPSATPSQLTSNSRSHTPQRRDSSSDINLDTAMMNTIAQEQLSTSLSDKIHEKVRSNTSPATTTETNIDHTFSDPTDDQDLIVRLATLRSIPNLLIVRLSSSKMNECSFRERLIQILLILLIKISLTFSN
jgi:hypothetical protein